jgi:hypothetical protein
VLRGVRCLQWVKRVRGNNIHGGNAIGGKDFNLIALMVDNAVAKTHANWRPQSSHLQHHRQMQYLDLPSEHLAEATTPQITDVHTITTNAVLSPAVVSTELFDTPFTVSRDGHDSGFLTASRSTFDIAGEKDHVAQAQQGLDVDRVSHGIQRYCM